MRSFILSASILSADFRHLEDEILSAVDAGADWIHIDVMDGRFVPNITMGPFIVECIRKVTTVPIDVHLMIEKPENHIKAFANAGADFLTIHPEGNPNVLRTLQEIHLLGCKTGLALNPGTPEIVLKPVLDFLDLVLILTVNPGFSGQDFIPQVIYKITEIRKMVDSLKKDIFVQADGGINQLNIRGVLDSGATVIVSSSAIFQHPKGIKKSISLLRDAAS